METYNKETLLIVDDSRFQRVVLKEMLSDKFNLIEVSGGEECLEYMKKENSNIDMVLLDLIMPGIDGFEVLRRRQDMFEFKSVPVIVLTTSDSIEFQTEAFELGADEYINKPVDVRIAISRINNMLSAKRHLDNVLEEQRVWKEKSQIDAMTHMFNKATTEAMINETIKTNNEALNALMVIDIDNFKSVNDTLGHKVGDHVICVIASVISSVVGVNDITGRFGGDEFVVMLRYINSQKEAEQIAAKIVDVVKKKENLTIPETISVSIGMAFFNDEKNCSELFSKADEALYISKKAGKGCFSVYGRKYDSEIVNGAEHKVLIWSASRNIISTLEYELPHTVSTDRVSSIEDVREYFDAKENNVMAIYVDFSDYPYDGKELWDILKKETWLKKCPIIAICKEGNINQIKYAVNSGIIMDLMLAPLEVAQLKRRVNEYMSYYKISQEEKDEQ